MMVVEQRALRFTCNGSGLVGIVEVPERPLPRGVLVVTGGPQYRVGSHRQFAMLARALSQRGIPVMRFDHRGMGDSEGEPRSFDLIDDDIHAAMKEFFMQVPEMKEVVIWGLCDAATAAVFYAGADDRVVGLVLLNPWVRTPEGAARAMLRHYYLAKLGEVAFWKKVASGNLDFAASAATLRQNVRLAASDRGSLLPQRVVDCLAQFDGRVMVVLSGDDITAREFARLMTRYNVRAKRVDITGANHTFSSDKWRTQVAEASANWIMSW
ncbi:MAG: Hydrolase 1, exosortase system-associated [Massilia sp.]|jgi:exosortase A-associated hydrolase 1|nr:Hydrolase 1, exosortase system-associated [Massilia sp.]